MSPQKHVVGLDIGSQSVKLTHLNWTAGEFTTHESPRKPPSLVNQQWVVELPLIFQRIQDLFSQISGRIKRSDEVAIGLSTIGEAITFGKDIETLGPSLLLGPAEAVSNLDATIEQLSETDADARNCFYSTYKIRELVESGCVDATFQLRCVEDYLVESWCGQGGISRSISTRTGAYDVANKCWREDLLRYLRIGPQCLSTVVPDGWSATMTEASAKRLGLPGRPLVVLAGWDQLAAFEGVRPALSELVVNFGSVLALSGNRVRNPRHSVPSETLIGSSTSPIHVELVYSPGVFLTKVHAMRHSSNGRQWRPTAAFADLGRWEIVYDSRSESYVKALDEIGTSGVSRAVFMTAALEVALKLGEFGKVSLAHLVGGGGRSRVLAKVLANAIERTVTVTDSFHASSIGALTVAARVAGLDISEFQGRLVAGRTAVEPDTDLRNERERYASWKAEKGE